MLNNIWIQFGGMGLLGLLFYKAMQLNAKSSTDNATATRENTAAVNRLVGMMEAFFAGQAQQLPVVEAKPREQLRNDPAPDRPGAPGFCPDPQGPRYVRGGLGVEEGGISHA